MFNFYVIILYIKLYLYLLELELLNILNNIKLHNFYQEVFNFK